MFLDFGKCCQECILTALQYWHCSLSLCVAVSKCVTRLMYRGAYSVLQWVAISNMSHDWCTVTALCCRVLLCVAVSKCVTRLMYRGLHCVAASCTLKYVTRLMYHDHITDITHTLCFPAYHQSAEDSGRGEEDPGTNSQKSALWSCYASRHES